MVTTFLICVLHKQTWYHKHQTLKWTNFTNNDTRKFLGFIILMKQTWNFLLEAILATWTYYLFIFNHTRTLSYSLLENIAGHTRQLLQKSHGQQCVKRNAISWSFRNKPSSVSSNDCVRPSMHTPVGKYQEDTRKACH